MSTWLQNWNWEWVPVAVLVWVFVLGAFSWLLTNLMTRPPRHH